MLRRAFFAFLLLVLALPGARMAAFAQGENVMNWRATLPVERAAPRPRQTYQPRRRTDAPRAPVRRQEVDPILGIPIPDPPVAVLPPPDENRAKIALIGDSFAEALAFGFAADQGFNNEFLLRSRLVSAAGLVRDDFHNWEKTLAGLFAEQKDLSALVIMLGLNDKQAMRVGSESFEPLSDGWRAQYRQRVDALLVAARAQNVPVIWIGMPVVRLPRLSADLMAINDIARERVQLAGQTWVDLADAFADGAGGFSLTGPDVIGDIVRLRGPDGIHFTPAGQRKLAFFVERPLRRVIGERKPVAPASPVLPTIPLAPETTPAPRPEASVSPFVPQIALPQSPGDLGIPVPSLEGLAIAMPRPRPLIGQTRALNETRPAQSLVGRQGAGFADETSRIFFERGLAPPPRAGRSDDYGWRQP